MSESDRCELVVVGGGPGGYPAAFHAADLGLEVTLVDPEAQPGGVCLHRGCIPSKALLHAAAAIREAREAEAFGVTFGEPRLDVGRLRAWKESVVSTLTGGLSQLTRARRIRFVRGRARFESGEALRVTRPDGGEELLRFRACIVATGSEPAALPLAPASPRVMDSTAALALEEVPGRLLVIGGGYIGLELGQAYAAFGSRVSVVEALPALLAGADPDLVRPLAARLRQEFEAVLLDTRVLALDAGAREVAVRLADQAGQERTEVYDRVLVAVGRRPVTRDLGLERTRARVDGRGFVVTDAQRRTAEPSIFAVGDVAGQPMLAHKATYEGRLAAEAVAGRKSVFDARAIPAVVFTRPELAWVGLSEREARERGLEVAVSTFPWAASGRAVTLRGTEGLTKLVCDRADGRVLGAGVTGPGAGELIAEAALAIELGAVAEDLARTIHAHPTLGETVMEAAEGVDGHATHAARRERPAR